ncbi:MAG: winged helix-turn-helix transcriptional regulator [Parcubacteria group bacterium]|nr:winged helix-turn-helix transcriptional regulator [Parcubacteria group bacterium]
METFKCIDTSFPKQKKLTQFFEALAHEHRLRIIHLFLRKDQLRFPDIQKHISLSQPALSHHIARLVRVGIVHVEKRGRVRHYHFNKDTFRDFLLALTSERQHVTREHALQTVTGDQSEDSFWKRFFS